MITLANLSQLNPTQAVDPNQQAFNNWYNSINQSTEMAQHLNPSTLAGMALGQMLGTWGGWQTGNWWQNLQEKLREKKLQEQGKKNTVSDNLSVQNQLDYWKSQGIPKPQAVSLFDGLINQQAVDAKNIDFTQPYNFAENVSNPYRRYAMLNPNASISEINRAGNLDWRNRLNEKFDIGNFRFLATK